MTALWTFNHIAMNQGGAAGASESPSIRYVKDESTFRATQYTFSLRGQDWSPPCKTCKVSIKTFPVYVLKSNSTVIEYVPLDVGKDVQD